MDHPDMRPLPHANNIRLTCFLCLIVTFALLSAELLRDQLHRQDDAINQVAAASQQLNLQLTAMLRETDLALDDLAANPLIDAAITTPGTRATERIGLETALAVPGQHLPLLRRIRLVDDSCREIATSDSDDVSRPVDNALCFWLRGHGRRPGRTFTSADRVEGGLFHAIRIHDATHRHAAMLIAQISGDGLTAMMADIAGGNDATLTIRDRHQLLAASWPAMPRDDQPAASDAMREIRVMENHHQIYDLLFGGDRGARLYSERALDDYPLSVTVGISRHALRAGLLTQAASYLAGWLLLVVFAIAVMRNQLRQVAQTGRLRAKATQLFSEQARQHAVFDALPIAVLLVEPANCRIRKANGKARTLLQLGDSKGLPDADGDAYGNRFRLAPIDQWLQQGRWDESCEIDVVDSDRVTQRLRVTLAPIVMEEETLCMVTLQDCGDRRHLEAALAAAQATIERLTSTDTLTGLANRKTAMQILERENERCRRYGHPLCVAMLDLDHFAAFNERYGREAGDNVLIAIANTLRDSTRETDLCARIDGEEFLVIFTNTPLKYAHQVMERIRAHITATVFPIGDRHVTFSGALTCWRPNDDMDAMLKRVAFLVMQARDAGRNRVSCDEDPLG